MSKGWTEERRRAQAERCRRNKPWENSTGPKTKAGKARSAMNSYKHGSYSALFPEIRHLLRLNKAFVQSYLQYRMIFNRNNAIENELIKRQLNQRGDPTTSQK